MKVLGYLIVGLGAVALIAFLIASSALLQGFVLTYLWLWFVTSTFHLAPLALPEAVGLVFLTSYLTYHYAYHHKDEDGALTKLSSNAAAAYLYPLVVLGCGWVIHTYFMVH